MAEDGKHHSAIRRAIKEAGLHDRLHKTEIFEWIQCDKGFGVVCGTGVVKNKQGLQKMLPFC